MTSKVVVDCNLITGQNQASAAPGLLLIPVISYFIVEKGYCYFANQPSTVYYVEKYKYTFDSKSNTLMCYGYDEESDTYDNEPWYIKVKSVSDTKLIIELLNDDNQTVDDTRDCVRQ